MKFRAAWVCLFFLTASPAPGMEQGAGITRLLQIPLPAKVEFCGESIPIDRDDVWERLDTEMVVILGSPVSTTLWFKRSARYFPLVEEISQELGLPRDLKYVAVIESNLRADAVSPASATGPWQFMSSTGSACGLDRTSWKDERRDWELATRAALGHLAELKSEFGSWTLALAAYNAGRNRVVKALEIQDENTFFGLRLPRETERYVFRAVAAKLIIENPESYGIDLAQARLYGSRPTAKVTLEVDRRQLPLSAVARAAGTSFRSLVELNPWMVGKELPRGVHLIRVPAESRERFVSVLREWERANPEPQTVRYLVRKGDTLTGIAIRHGVQLEDVCAWNNVKVREAIYPGQEIVLHMLD